MGCRPYDEYDTMEDIRNARKDSDRIIVIYHGGKEHCRYPSPRLRRLCHAMAKNGADVVLCQHSHCIGCYEKFNDCHILYGQGNFHFVRPKELPVPETWNTSLMVKYDTITREIEFIPTINYDFKGITLAKGSEKDEIMSGFEKRNKELLTGRIKTTWCIFNFITDIISLCKGLLYGVSLRSSILYKKTAHTVGMYCLLVEMRRIQYASHPVAHTTASSCGARMTVLPPTKQFPKLFCFTA